MSSIYDDDYYLPQLDKVHTFPSAREAPEEGLVAFGGDLNPNRILKAYKEGIFPWYSPEDPLLWWSPNPRLVLFPENLKKSKSFKRVLRNKGFEVRFDQDFEAVINHCANVPRAGQEGTWLSDEMKASYIELYHMGFAHSVETYYKGQLVGGLYGLALGRAFFGESMFSLMTNASRVSLTALSDICVKKSYDFIDCQVETPHLVSWGAILIERDDFLDLLEDTLEKDTDFGSWRDWNWEYDE
ncbi:MAG: Leucyl/phenylalanyl-tRNA--protein transferase (EC [uncultured Sulfurovum sp.]|uniref:Leucyl/phenylalanyl-tRNA--protein transferase n=1 Tax=uncultured Sulfurovum sp. TaxID=269237 RepID=A0A6S6TWZ9_9BACT|nr:MAG: Leucyl/phenylalanyl-tRNA--protein transferase (EC [uncultured Sulfurovum sp.]